MNPGITCANSFNASQTVPDILGYRNGIQGCLIDCGGPGGGYCSASAANADEYISNVSFGSIDHNSNASNYSDFTNISTDLARGTGTPITVTLVTTYPSDIGGIWIDYNQDEDFSDPGETVFTGFSGVGPYSITVNVPGTAALGETRMRLRIQDGGVNPTLDACGSAEFGEVEDYTVVIVNDVPQGPGNDDCEDAMVVGAGTVQFDTFNATTDGPDEPFDCDFFGNSHIESDVWFEYTATCNALVTASLCNSGYDTKIAVYESCPELAGQVIACNDDACGIQGIRSETFFGAVEGQTYLIRVGGFEGAQGNGVLTIIEDCLVATGACCFADGTCDMVDESTCGGTGGDYAGDNVMCATADCPQPPDCPEDIDGDGSVGFGDLIQLLSVWGPCPGCPEDIDGDGSVGFADLVQLLSVWGPC